MSYAELLAIYPNEKFEPLYRLQNAYGGSYILWDALVRKYISNGDDIYWLNNQSIVGKLWTLYQRKEIPTPIRAVHGFTLDRAYVKRDNFTQFGEDISQMMTLLHFRAHAVNHWHEIEGYFRSSPDVPAIGFYGTSVGENSFQGEYNEKLEDYESIDWSTTFEVYEDLHMLHKQ